MIPSIVARFSPQHLLNAKAPTGSMLQGSIGRDCMMNSLTYQDKIMLFVEFVGSVKALRKFPHESDLKM